MSWVGFLDIFSLIFLSSLFCRLGPKAVERVLQHKVVDIVMSKLESV
jgi:hypothetical protein